MQIYHLPNVIGSIIALKRIFCNGGLNLRIMQIAQGRQNIILQILIQHHP